MVRGVTTPRRVSRDDSSSKQKRPITARAPRSTNRRTATNGLKRPREEPTSEPDASIKRRKDEKSNERRKPTLPFRNPLPAVPSGYTGEPLRLFFWGSNFDGQLGLPGVDEAEIPAEHTWAREQTEAGSFGLGIESVEAGGLHTYLLDAKGIVWSCGINDDAVLGRVTANVPNPDNPSAMQDEEELNQTFHPLNALVEQGFCAVRLAAGDNIGAAVDSKGELRIWGTFKDREEGGMTLFSEETKHQFLPVPARIPRLVSRGRNVEKVSQIATGSNHILVLTTHGHIYSWGSYEDGQLGRLGQRVLERHKRMSRAPDNVVLGKRTRKAVHIGTGRRHSFAIDVNGDVWAWGLNGYGQTGISPEISIVQQPTKVDGLSPDDLEGDRVVQIAAGEEHSLFLTAEGRLYACGRCEGGQLGQPRDSPVLQNVECVHTPLRVHYPNEDSGPVTHISAGGRCNMVITRSGTLFCWGEGNSGELGVSGETEIWTPREVVVKRQGSVMKAVQVSCGGQHVFGLFRSEEST